MPNVVMYSTKLCPFCHRARQLLTHKGVEFEDIGVDFKPDLRAEMAAKAGKTSVPQIWIGDFHVGGCDELFRLEQQGQLDQHLAGN